MKEKDIQYLKPIDIVGLWTKQLVITILIAAIYYGAIAMFFNEADYELWEITRVGVVIHYFSAVLLSMMFVMNSYNLFSNLLKYRRIIKSKESANK